MEEDDDTLAILERIKVNDESSITLMPEDNEESDDSFHPNDNACNTSVASKLKQFIYPVQPIQLNHFKTGSSTLYPSVYECRVLSVHGLNMEAEAGNNSTNVVNNNTPTTPEPNIASINQRNIDMPIPSVHVEEALNNETVNESVVIPSLIAGPSSTMRTKRRPLKHTLATGRLGAVEAWVLLDSEGNTQEVSERDVNILLGGRSVDSVLSMSTEHQMPPSILERNSQSETGTARLEPIIQESLLLLRRDNSIGEQALSRRLNLERKTENMLMHITQPNTAETDEMQPTTSVHFVNIETDRLIQWRHSQDFNGAYGHKFESFMTGRIFQGASMLQPSAPSIHSVHGVLQETSEVDITDHEQTESVKSSPSMKKKSFNILRKLLPNNKSKATEENSATDKSTIEHILSDIRENTNIARIKLEEDAVKYQKLAERNSRLLQEEKYKTTTLQLELMRADEKERQANIDNEETFLANYPLGTSDNEAIYEMLNDGCQSIKAQETALEILKRDIQELKFSMFESENAIKQSIVQYIMDKQVEKQLLNAIDSYSTNKIEGEHRVNALTQDLIDEQVGFLRNHKQNTEANIKALRKRNEALEDENILLLKKIEKLQSRSFRRSGEFNVKDLICPDKDENNYAVKNNELLRNKLSFNRSRIQTIESQLQDAVAKVEYFESQIRNLKIEAENQKLFKGRMEVDHEIKYTALNVELQVKSQILQQSIQAADILVDDMESLTKLLKDTGSQAQIRWSKLHGGDNSLVDLLHIGRSCINELGRELINTHNRLKAANQEIVRQEDRKQELKKSLVDTTNKNCTLKIKLEEVSHHKTKAEHLLEQLSQENARLHDHLGIAVESQMAMEEEINKIKDSKNMQTRPDVISEKVGKAIQEVFANNVKKEMDSQIKRLMEENRVMLENVKAAELNTKMLQNKLLAEGEIRKIQNYEGKMAELQRTNTALCKEVEILRQHSQPSTSETSVKLVMAEKEINVLKEEKDRLTQELQSYKIEREALLETQHAYLTQNQLIQKDFEILLQENKTLQTQHEQTMLLCLGHDGSQGGVSGVAQIENSIRNMQAELVGKRDKRKNLEYIVNENNKKIEHLEKSSSKKDLLIRSLDHQIAQMSNINQLELVSLRNKKEQLEANLKTVSWENDERKAILAAAQEEIQVLSKKVNEKNIQLDRYKDLEHELECHYTLDRERAEETATLKGRLKDYNNISNQRDKLIESQKEFLTEVENLHNNLKRREKKVDSLTKECTTQAIKITELEEKLKYTRSVLNKTSGSADTNFRGVQGLQMELKDATTKLTEYEKHITEMDRGIEKHVLIMEQDRENIQEEKIKLEEEVNHLKSVINGQQASLDKALKQLSEMRKVEKELRNEVDDERKQKYSKDEIIKKQEETLTEMATLKEELLKIKLQYSQLDLQYHEYQDNVAINNEGLKNTSEKQLKFLEDSRQQLHNQDKEKTALEKELEVLTANMATIEERNQQLENNVGAHGKTVHELLLAKRNSKEQLHLIMMLESDKSKLEALYKLLQSSHSEVESELLATKTRLSETLKELDESYTNLEQEQSSKQQAIASVKSLHNDQMKRLLKEIKDLGLAKQQVEQSVLEEKRTKETLERQHDQLSDKLSRAVRLAIEEKMTRQNVELQVQQLETIKQQLESEKETNDATIKELTENVHMLTQRTAELKKEKEELVEMKTDLRKQSENRLEVLKKEVIDLRNKLIDTDNHSANEVEILKEHIAFKDELLQIKEKQIQSIEERINRLTNELTEARECLLKQRQLEGNLQREILHSQAEKRELSSQLNTLDGQKHEETRLRLELQKTCQGLLDEMTKCSVTPRSASRVKKLIATTLPTQSPKNRH